MSSVYFFLEFAHASCRHSIFDSLRSVVATLLATWFSHLTFHHTFTCLVESKTKRPFFALRSNERKMKCTQKHINTLTNAPHSADFVVSVFCFVVSLERNSRLWVFVYSYTWADKPREPQKNQNTNTQLTNWVNFYFDWAQ